MKKLFSILLFLLPAFSFAQVVCNITYERTIQNFDVYLQNPSGNTMYRAKMYIDADGSPRAYGPNNSGLDYTANAGYTGNWWGVVADPTGTNPIQQTASDPYPGMYVSTTSLVNTNYPASNPLRYVNSETVPFFVLPSPVVSSGGIHIGDVGYVYNTTTGQGCFAIYADAGPTTSLGEGSIFLAAQIGVDPDVRTGGTSSGIIDYIVFPQSGFGQGYIPTIAQIDSIGNLKLAAAGGNCIVSCIGPVVDATAPVTQIANAAPWDTTDFPAAFTDTDNGCAGGVEKSFYNASDFNGIEWRANNANGFFADDFNQPAINTEWTTVTGTWNSNANVLEQNDEVLSNTNIYASLTQDLSNSYLYEWSGKISGTGNNRRAGFHFFADNGSSVNRGNGYFVWFRVDQSVCEFYKVTNDVFSLVHSVPMTVNANQWYNWKVIYDRITGEISVYKDNTFVGSYTDASHYTNGSYISFRSGNCNWQVDDFKVYRSRTISGNPTISMGNSSADIRYQDQNPFSPSGKIYSVAADSAHNLSTIPFQFINADWTLPSAITFVNDGTANDADTTFNGAQLEANWPAATDLNSGVTNYYYAIGTTPGGNDVVSWTNNGSSVSVTATGLTLTHLQIYYVSVISENAAGMKSTATVSDGILYFDITTGVHEPKLIPDFTIYPNPGNGDFILNAENRIGEIVITNENGVVVYQAKSETSSAEINLENQPSGNYFVTVKTATGSATKTIIVQH